MEVEVKISLISTFVSIKVSIAIFLTHLFYPYSTSSTVIDDVTN